MKANRPHRVMVVDDNRDAADSMAMMLEANGHTVLPVYDGREALRLFAEFKPNAALLDIGLPHISGYELATQFRQQGIACALIAISGWGTDRDKEQARRWGFDLHLTKPADPHAVIAMLDDLCAAALA
ncbi:MAG TPA: response regulator [Usitatibacter sp.]|nr:response regulator [Usitatibacter sp.]